MKNRLIVNPTTDDFRDAVAAEVFVDKSELIPEFVSLEPLKSF